MTDTITTDTSVALTDVAAGKALRSRNARALEPGLKTEIEVGRIDADEHIRPLGNQSPGEPSADAGQLAVVSQHLEQPIDRESLARPQHIEAGGLHLRATDAVELRLR